MEMKLFKAKGRLFISSNIDNVYDHIRTMLDLRNNHCIEELPRQSIVVIGSQSYTLPDLIKYYQSKASKAKVSITERTSILVNDGRLT